VKSEKAVMTCFSNKIYKIIFSLLFAIPVILYSIFSNALPAPLSNEQLLKQSDIIAKVKVIGVAKIGQINGAVKYHAWLKILEPTKGSVSINDTIIVAWHKFDKKLIGSWAIDYYPDDELLTYLIWDDNEKSYKNISWNSAKKIQSYNKKLPINDGEIIFSSEYCSN
jgi:hypothetical protein